MVVVVVIGLFMGVDPRNLMNLVQQAPQAQQAAPANPNAPTDDQTKFVKVVLADTEEVWQDLFTQMGRQYEDPTLVIFRDQVRSACGFQSAATGPFYCPADKKVYIDLSFYDQMKNQLNAPGDFAQAYVIAHEIGHHVQNLLGISDRVHAERRTASEAQANQQSVRLELQADFFAGIWAHYAQQRWKILEEGDIEEALNAANAIGDNRLQMESRGYVVPESFTHGTSEQRVRWFSKGFKTGDMGQADTFSIPYDRL